MFTTKKSSLFSVPAKTSVKKSTIETGNQFLFGAKKEAAKVLSGNGAIKFSTTNNPFVDQFGVLGSYKTPRQFNEIVNDCETLWAEDKSLCVKFIAYIRTINRKTDIVLTGIKTDQAQVGAELKYEGIMRMLWLSQKDAKAFWNNVGLFLSVGSCKDIVTMLQYDLMFHGWEGRKLDWNKFGDLIKTLLDSPDTVNLMKKYLPQIKARSACKSVESQADNIIAKWICSILFGNKENSSNYKKYRQLKVSGNAHEWQQLISQKQFTKIDFKKIHGRALNLLVKSKFLKNQGLSFTYEKWVDAQETVKYTGFVHELLCELDSNRENNFVKTVDKQFLELVNKVKGSDENLTKFIVVRDTSASMGSIATGTKFSCMNIGKALALYFSEFLTGTFANHWIEFNSDAKLHQWKGATASARWYADRSSYVGGTDFQSVINLFCKMKKQGTPEADFPNGILCISDSEFNPVSLGKTNVEQALDSLRKAGFSKDYLDTFKIVLWNLQSGYYGSTTGKKFETFGDVKNVYYFSGYSAATVKFLLDNKVETAADLFLAAMDQQVLNLIQV